MLVDCNFNSIYIYIYNWATLQAHSTPKWHDNHINHKLRVERVECRQCFNLKICLSKVYLEVYQSKICWFLSSARNVLFWEFVYWVIWQNLPVWNFLWSENWTEVRSLSKVRHSERLNRKYDLRHLKKIYIYTSEFTKRESNRIS